MVSNSDADAKLTAILGKIAAIPCSSAGPGGAGVACNLAATDNLDEDFFTLGGDPVNDMAKIEVYLCTIRQIIK
jgi:hypothetical protein